MIHRTISRLSAAALVILILSSIGFAFAGSVTVPDSRLAEESFAITVSDLIPAECSSISSMITVIVVCSGGNCSGTTASELILGTAGDDSIDGKNGFDCIVGGDGNDMLNGGNDNDVLIGGNGNDGLDGGPKKDTDICYGGTGANTFTECDLAS